MFRMITRKVLMLATMMIILIAGIAIPVFADQDKDKTVEKTKDNNSDKKTDTSSADSDTSASDTSASDDSNSNKSDSKANNGNSNSSDKKSGGSTQVTNDTTVATPTITPAPSASIAGNSGKVKIGNLHKPVKTESVANVTITAPAVVSNAPFSDSKLRAEKMREDKVQADRKIKVTVSQLDIYIRMVNNTSMSDSDKALLITEANENIAWYKQMNQDILGSSDMGAVQGMIADVNRHSELIKADLKRDAGLLSCDETYIKIATARNVSGLAELKIAAAAVETNTTLLLNQLLYDYNAHVDAAAQRTDSAKANFDSITPGAGSDQYFNAGCGELKQAEIQLDLAYADLKEIYGLLYSNK